MRGGCFNDRIGQSGLGLVSMGYNNSRLRDAISKFIDALWQVWFPGRQRLGKVVVRVCYWREMTPAFSSG